MPAQQISPSAAMRSPWPSAIFAAFLKVSTMRAVLAFGFSRHFCTPNSAESTRMTPYWRTPCLLRSLAMRQAFSIARRNFCCCSSVPIAESPTVPPQTGATSEPTFRPLEAMRSAICLRLSSEMSGSVCGWNRNRSTPSNLWPSTLAATVMSSMCSRAIGGWSVLGSLPTRPGHIALCSFMGVGVG
jgi:hypothetical protein